MELTVEINGQDALDAALALRLEVDQMKEVRSLRSWFRGRAFTIILSNNRRQFLTEGKRFGSQWAGLSDWTQRLRTAAGFGAAHPILRQTDRLFDLATKRGGGSIPTVTPFGLTVDFGAVPYGEDHLLGRMISPDGKERPIPVRRWLPPDDGTPAMNDEIETSLANELERRAAKNLRKKIKRGTVEGPSDVA